MLWLDACAKLQLVTAVTVLTFFIVNCNQGQEDGGHPVDSVKNIDLILWQQAYDNNQRLIVVLYSVDKCGKCQQALDIVAQLEGQPEVPSGVEIGKSSDPSLMSFLSVSHYPVLLFLREKSHVFYDGNFDIEDVLDWIQLASSQFTHKLNDDSFEHLTQASTGATTGDWLVAFYQDSCKQVLPVLDSFGVRVHGRINTAIVDITKSPGLVERFKVTDCPGIVYFRRGKMYKYTMPNLDVTSFQSFVDGFYKNVQAQVVPVPKSKFDLLTESIADYLRDQLEGEHRSIFLAALCAGAVTLILIVFFCCRQVTGVESKTKSE